MTLALSIRQPWAWAIIHVGKDIENRTWDTKVRGTILVHASGGMTRREYDDFVDVANFVNDVVPPLKRFTFPALPDLQRGGIIGTVEIVDCVKDSTSPWFFGPFGFVLKNPKPMPFVPLKGKLGFFEVPESATVDQKAGVG